jgi:hypothetical protein
MVSSASHFFIVLCSIFSSCDAVDRQSSSFLSVRAVGNFLREKTRNKSVMKRKHLFQPKKGGGGAPFKEVETTLSKLSPLAKETFSEDVARQTLGELSRAYEGNAHDAYVSVDSDAIAANMSHVYGDDPHNAGVYGEILPESVLHMLALAAKYNPNLRDQDGKFKPGRYVDLGSGNGKSVLLAGLLGFEGDGVELADPRFKIACSGLERLGKAGNASSTECGSHGLGHVKFTKGSFLDDKVSLDDTDVVFTDSVYWSDDMMQTLAAKAAKMKPGSVIFSFKAFPGEQFKHLSEETLGTSWDTGTTWQFQQVGNEGTDSNAISSFD